MKKSILTILSMALVISLSAQNKLSFHPGINTNGLTIGKVNEKGRFYVGLNFISMSEKYDTFDSNNQPTTNKYAVRAFLPTLGYEKTVFRIDQVQSTFNTGIFVPIILTSDRFDSDTNTDNEFVLGFKISYGLEYFFNDQFSIGADYGWRGATYNAGDSDNVDRVSGGGMISTLSLNFYIIKGE